MQLFNLVLFKIAGEWGGGSNNYPTINDCSTLGNGETTNALWMTVKCTFYCARACEASERLRPSEMIHIVMSH